jgi:hypothetical protein
MSEPALLAKAKAMIERHMDDSMIAFVCSVVRSGALADDELEELCATVFAMAQEFKRDAIADVEHFFVSGA